MEPVTRAVLHTDHHNNYKHEPPVFINVAENIFFRWTNLPAVELVKDQQKHKSVKDQSQMNFLLYGVWGVDAFDGFFGLGGSIIV